jgi:hypothetical protein
LEFFAQKAISEHSPHRNLRFSYGPEKHGEFFNTNSESGHLATGVYRQPLPPFATFLLTVQLQPAYTYFHVLLMF